MIKIRLYRRRFIPNEIIELKDDIILAADSNIIITKWKVIRPRNDFAWGCSCYYLKEGFKISKIFDFNNNFVYWYCDIIEAIVKATDNSIVFNDLLVDIIIYKDGFVKVMDLNELSDALDYNIIDIKTLKAALQRLSTLLDIIYEGRFDEFTKGIEAYLDI